MSFQADGVKNLCGGNAWVRKPHLLQRERNIALLIQANELVIAAKTIRIADNRFPDGGLFDGMGVLENVFQASKFPEQGRCRFGAYFVRTGDISDPPFPMAHFLGLLSIYSQTSS